MKKVQRSLLLQNWNYLNGKLMGLRESEVAELLLHEQKRKNRITFVMRLHSRLNKLRRERERSVLAAKAGVNVVMIPGVKYK